MTDETDRKTMNPITRHLSTLLLVLLVALPASALQLPELFHGLGKNAIAGSAALDSTFRLIARGDTAVRILHIGDSHVRGGVFPATVGQVLADSLHVGFSSIGINGARASRFSQPDILRRIEAERPNMVIISFGTNEAAGHYSEADHAQALETLMDSICALCPGATILLTTPPGAYVATKRAVRRSSRGRRGRRRSRVHYIYSHRENANTPRVAGNIRRVGEQRGVAVWDLFNIVGGERYACRNWRCASLMRPDRIHYTPEGYRLQGQMLGEAIVAAYREYTDNNQGK